jgi:hypothetical protein
MNIIPKDIIFVESTNEWIVDGKVIPDHMLTIEEKQNLKSIKKNYELITNVRKNRGEVIF